MNEQAPIERIPLSLGARGYEILVGDGLITDAATHLQDLLQGRRAHIITDETVGALWLKPLEDSLSALGIAYTTSIIAPGEGSKSFAMLETLTSRLVDFGVERRDIILALGGGVVGDLAGFTASVLLRGIDFIQLPTTLLSQVDSSVGGKTGINLPGGKNLVGAFYQPRRVLIDLDTCDSLPPRQRRAGYAEIVKYGLIDDPDFFIWLETNGDAVLKGERAALAHAIAASCRAKARIVSGDEREQGMRALLNLGHSFGHALEAYAGYDGSLLHGEAVAIGLMMALTLSVRLGLAPEADAARLRAHLTATGLPARADALGHHFEPERIMALMARDKKVVGGRLTLILLRGIGKAFLSREVHDDQLFEHVKDCLV